MKPKLIILCGLPFSGKSTLARSISEALGVDILSYDHDIYAKHKNKVPAGTSKAKEYDLVQAIARDQLRDLLNKRQSVIYDDLCLEISDRKYLLDLAHECNATVVILFVDTSLDVIEQRRQANLQSNDRDHIDEDTMQLDISLLQPPTRDEGAISIEPGYALQEILRMIENRLL